MKLLNEDIAQYNMFSFSTATLNDILSHFSKIDFKKIILGYLVMVSMINVKFYLATVM